MNDKRIKENCPVCGCDKNEIQLKVLRDGVARCECPKCRMTFAVWTSKQEAIDKWNQRFR